MINRPKVAIAIVALLLLAGLFVFVVPETRLPFAVFKADTATKTFDFHGELIRKVGIKP